MGQRRTGPRTSALVLKIVDAESWAAARRAGAYHGSADDLRDGFIHLSTPAQVRATAARHFAGRPDLLLVAFETDRLGSALRWEPSRGGDLFPHLYSPLDTAAALWEKALTLDSNGAHVFPEEIDR